VLRADETWAFFSRTGVGLFKVDVLAPSGVVDQALLLALAEEGIAYSISRDIDSVDLEAKVIILDVGSSGLSYLESAAAKFEALKIPLLCALPKSKLDWFVPLKATDFFLVPPAKGEISARLARCMAVNRMSLNGAHGSRRSYPGLHIDKTSYDVFYRGRRLVLTFKEYELLSKLAGHPGKVFTREALLSEVWQYDYYEGARTVDVHIRRLRSKLEDTGQSLIETVRNVGYRLRPDGVEVDGEGRRGKGR